ncbi:MAG: molecular chaperone TorD family protein [Thermodesulfobacteriota bacterium]
MRRSQEEKQSVLEAIRKLSDIFWGPDSQKCAEIWKEEYWASFEKNIPRSDTDSGNALAGIWTWLRTFTGPEDLCSSLEENYVRLFISDRQGIKTPLYASCYEGDDPKEKTPLMGQAARAMMERFYSRGLGLAEDLGEPPDHLSIELEYLYYILEKGWEEDNELLLQEASSFSTEVMLPWVRKFRQGLTSMEKENPFYLPIATLLCGILQFVGNLSVK